MDNDRTRKLEALAERAFQAEALISNAAFRRAFDDVQLKIVADMANVALTETAAHTTLITSLQNLALVRGALEAAIRDGKIATTELRQAEVRATPVRR